MIERAEGLGRRPRLSHAEIIAAVGLDAPGVTMRSTPWGDVHGKLSDTLSYTLDVDTLADGLRRGDLQLRVRGPDARAAGSYRWLAYRGDVLSLYLVVEAPLRGDGDSVRPSDWDIAVVHRRLHRYDGAGWRRYALDRGGAFGQIPDPDAEQEFTEVYLALLGLTPTQDEYGWICEYSTVGMPPVQREAVLALVAARRVDLLRKVLCGPSPEGRLYAAEALVFLEMIAPGAIDSSSAAIIRALVARNEVIMTCGNAGSYRLYPMRFTELFNESTDDDLVDRFLEARDSAVHIEKTPRTPPASRR